MVFLIPVALLSGVITSQSLDLYEKISKGLQDGSLKNAFNLKISSVSHLFERFGIDLHAMPLEEKLGNLLKNLSEFIYTEMAAMAKGLVGIVFDLVIVLFICFFLLIDGEKFLKEIKLLSPLEVSHHERIVQQLERTLKATLKGSIIVALAQGLLGGLGFWIFNIPMAAFWGVCMVFSSVIPLVGTSSHLDSSSPLLSLTSSFWMAYRSGPLGDPDYFRRR